MTLYERLGGEPAITALLEALYVRVLADPLMTPLLANIDLVRLKTHQFLFLSQALGGPHRYSGPSLVQAHAKLPLQNRHFDAFIDHLNGSLHEIGAAADLVTEILSNVTPLRGVIVNSPSGGASRDR